MNALNTSLIVPLNYSKTDCEVGIIHVGVGAFHRAHQAVYMNTLLGNKDQQKWGIMGINLRSQDANINLQLADQKHLYTLKTLSPETLRGFNKIRL